MSEEIKPYNASHDSPAAAAASQVNELEPSKQVTGVDQGIASPTGTTKQVDNSKTSKKPAAATAPTTVESVVAAAKRYIPGLNREPSETNKPKRNRNKKAGGAGTGLGKEVKSAEDPALATATLESAPDKSDLPDNLTVNGGGAGHGTGKRPAALNGTSNSITAEEQAVLDHKRFSPAALVQKRLKANGKKLQRIAGYENQTETLNADQKKAVASKPALDAVQRELSELIKVFETEEADDDKKVEKKKQYEDKQVQIKVNQAVSNANIHTQNDLTLLLQFLHLYSCFNPSQAFAPPTLPPVVANATAQQHAAVHSLFHNLANGPLFGGASSSSDSGDAIEQIKALQEGSNKDVIEGVSFADVKQMILDLTAPPNELEGASHEIPESSASAAGQLPGEDQQPPLAAAENGATGAGGAPSFNFMQASELSNGAQQSQEGNGVPLSPPNADDDAQHERALESHSIPATPGFGSAVGGQNSGVQTPNVVEPQMLADGGKTADGASGWEAPSSLLPNGAGATGAGWGDDTAPGSEPIKSWADDVDDANPINPFTTTAEVPSELSGTKPAGDDGFQSVGNDNAGSRGRGGRGGGYRGRGEGQPRGEGRGRGGGRGGERGSGRGGRGDGSMQWRRSDAPNADAATQAIRAAEGAGEVAPGAAGTVEGEARRGGGGYRGRGGRGNGGEGGRGSYRGSRGGDGEGRGSYRGRGEGRGEGRGGYRGGRGGAANAGATSAPVAAAAAPAQ